MAVMPLRRILVLQTLLAVALPFVLVAVAALIWIPPQIRQDVQQRQLVLAQAIGMQVKAHLKTAATLVRVAATLPLEDSLQLQAILDTTRDLHSLYAVQADGRVSLVALRAAEQAHLSDLLDLDLSGNPLFKRVSAVGSARWSETFLSAINGGLAVAYAVPGGAAMLIGEVDLNQLTTFLNQISSSQQNLLLIIDQSGQIVADSTRQYTAQQLNISNLPLVSTAIASDRPATGPFHFAGQKMTGSMIQIPEVNWHILVAQTDSSLYQTAREIALFGGGALLIALYCGILAAFYQSRKLAGSFAALNQHAKKVAGGDSSGQWPASSVSEFGQLAENLQIMELRLQEAANTLELYRYGLDNARDSLFIVTQDAHFKFANNAAGETLGYSREQFSQMTIFDLDPDFPPQEWPVHWDELREKGALLIETRHKTSDGSLIPVEISLKLFLFEGVEYQLSLARDLTERKQFEEERLNMERQLLYSQKLESLGVLAGGIAHDFNNILMAILGNAELAKRRLKRESPALENLQRIEQSAARAADLAKQMLAYSGKGKFVVEIIDLNSLLEEMLHMLEVSISKKAVLRFNQYRPLPTVEVDITQMRQIVMNLVINASEAIGDKSGIIAITTGCIDCDDSYLTNVWLDDNLHKGLYVYLEIADTGCGMDKPTIEKLFDPFFTTKFTGRGLGMSAVLGIVRGHQGAIKVYSEPGKGTTFKILLPASSLPVELFNGAVSDENWQGSGTILLVDDEETVRGIGSEMLKELGFAVVTAVDGRDALEKFRQYRPIRCVILDLTMPRMDGEQCFRELKQLDPQVRVIMSSGYNEQEVTEKFIGKGLAGFIQKPYTLSALKAVLVDEPVAEA